MNPAIDLVGSLLLHFLWQGLAIAAVAALLLWLLRSSIPQLRYLVACTAMLGMLVAPLVTARVLSHPDAVTQPQLRSQRLVRLEVAGPARGIPDAPVLSLAAAPPPRAATIADRLRAGAVGVWLVGVVLLSIRLAGGWWQVWRLRQNALARQVSAWQETADRLARRLRVTRAVRIVDSVLVDTPTLIGWLRPVVLLPVAALANLTPAQVEAILAHELAHVRRHDFLVNVLQAITETLFFYHPAVWWISSRVRIEREHCCDDVALMVSGDAVGYASALAELETWRATDRRLALAATDGTLAGRVRRLLVAPGAGETAAASAAFVTAILITAGIAGTILYSVGAVRAQAPAAAERARTELRVQWRRTSTEHFDISASPALATRAAAIGGDAERAYLQVSGDLHADLSTRPHIVLFESQAAMERMRTAGLMPSAGEGRAILFPLDRGERWLAAAMIHEVTHAFQADILGNLDAPLWFTEGLAEHEHGEWSDPDRIRLIGLLHTERLPSLRSLTTAIPDGAVAYAVGHAAFDFIDDRWGKEGVRQLLAAARTRGADLTTVYASTFKLTPDAFDREFAGYLRDALPPPPSSPLQPGATPTVEVVRPTHGGGPNLVHFNATRIEVINTTLRDLIRYAYGLQDGDVVGGPAWLDTDRFDIVATGDGDGSHLGSPALRDLLGRRLHLALRRDTRKAPGYALTLITPGRLGPRITPSTSDCAAASHDDTPRVRTFAAAALPGLPCGDHWLRGREGAEARANGVTMGMLARSLTLAMHTEQPIVDNTGLGGTFDFEMQLEPSLTDALRAQLGMQLVPIDLDVDVFIVDGIDRPSSN